MTTIGIIVTVLNERVSIQKLLESIAGQTRLPNQVVITDAGSNDGTVEAVQRFSARHPELHLTVMVVPGNRSVGRNAAINASQTELIAATDAGCQLDSNWLATIVEPLESGQAEFVGGWFQPIATNAWQSALVKVLNYREGAVNPKTFLPSTRSMAFTKDLWSRANGFDERLSHNEDTPFSIAMKKVARGFRFQPKAIVQWNPAASYGELYRQIRRYAFGDGQSGVFASHYKLLFAWLTAVVLTLILGWWWPLGWIVSALVGVGYLYLPLLFFGIQRISDLWYVPSIKAVMITAHLKGFLAGTRHRL